MTTIFLVIDPQLGVRGVFTTRRMAEIAILANSNDIWSIAEVPIGSIFGRLGNYMDSNEQTPNHSPRSMSSPPMFPLSQLEVGSPPLLMLDMSRFSR